MAKENELLAEDFSQLWEKLAKFDGLLKKLKAKGSNLEKAKEVSSKLSKKSKEE